MKTTRNEMAALKKLDSDKRRDVPRAMIAILAAKGLCTVMGNVTDAGRAALPYKRWTYTRLATVARMNRDDDCRRVAALYPPAL